jgi:hypothetical protein
MTKMSSTLDRLADEYGAAQERGEISGPSDRHSTSRAEVNKATVEDIGLTHKEIHEARLVRDAEVADPGIVRRSINNKLAQGEDSMRKIVASLNQHRRARTTPLSNAEKTARVEAELKRDPARSDNAIAKTVGVAQDFVGRTRSRLETRGVISNITPSERKSTTGKAGEGQRQPPARTGGCLSASNQPRITATHAPSSAARSFAPLAADNAQRAATGAAKGRTRGKFHRDRYRGIRRYARSGAVYRSYWAKPKRWFCCRKIFPW